MPRADVEVLSLPLGAAGDVVPIKLYYGSSSDFAKYRPVEAFALEKNSIHVHEPLADQNGGCTFSATRHCEQIATDAISRSWQKGSTSNWFFISTHDYKAPELDRQFGQVPELIRCAW